MILSTEAIKSVLNYIIEKQTFDFDNGKMKPIYLTSIVKDLSNNNDNTMQEIACAIVRCINEELVFTNYPQTPWVTSHVTDISFKGFAWLKENP